MHTRHTWSRMTSHLLGLLLVISLGITAVAQDQETFSDVPAPSLCDPSQPDLTAFGEENFPEGIEKTEVADGLLTLQAFYQNEQGQSFTLNVTGADENVIYDYLRQLKICFEAIPFTPSDIGIKEDEITDSSPYRAMLEEAVSSDIGIAIEERGELSWGQFLTNLGYEQPDLVFQKALDRLTEENPELADDLAAAYGEITTEGVDLEAIYMQQRLDPTILLVDAQPTFGEDLKEGEMYVIYYAIDPSISLYQTIYYMAKYTNYTTANIYGGSGKMTLTFWRTNPSVTINSIPVDALVNQFPNPSGLVSNLRTSYWHYVKVYGQANASSYSIYGSWTECARDRNNRPATRQC